MKEIKLFNGEIALIDTSDFDLVNSYKWALSTYGYAQSGNGKTTFKIHTLLLGKLQKPFQVDHINHNRLDNRRENLRIITHQQNILNKRKKSYRKGIPPTSSYIGVGWDKLKKKWISQIQVNKKHYRIGSFQNERHAAMARDIWAKDLFGEFAVLNFGGLDCPAVAMTRF